MLALSILFGAMWVRGRFVADTLRLDAGAGLTSHFFSGSGSLALAATDGGAYFKAGNDGRKTWWVYSLSHNDDSSSRAA